MRIWFDTEFFEDGSSIQLISIGLIREDGQMYYAETNLSQYLADRTPWLAENVKPKLTGGAAILRWETLRENLIQFAGERPEFWAYYGAYDWVALCQMFGTMMDLPKGWPMYCLDLKQACVHLGDPKLPGQPEDQKHHALQDAIWTRAAWDWLKHYHMRVGFRMHVGFPL